jgi:spermidine synthase
MRGSSAPLRSLAWIFAASGAAGLVHEVAWTRLLGQSLGHSLQSLTVVLVCFLGGLGLGAAAAARTAGRSSSPLRVYAFLEFAIAGWAALSPAVVAAISAALPALGPRVGGGASLPALRFALGLLALAPPTLAMGATFPYLVREATERGAVPARAVSVLYGVNTLGAAAGAGFGSFLLLPLLGTRLTILAAGALNAAAGAAALVLARRRAAARGALLEPTASPAAAEAGQAAPGRLARLSAIATAALSGGIGALLQVAWIRLTTLAFGSSVYAFGATLTAYILGLGTGPLLVRRFLGRAGSAVSAAAATIGLVGASSLCLLPYLGRLPSEAARISGRLEASAAGMIAVQFLLLFAVLLVTTVAQGGSFPALVILAGAGRETQRSAGLIYAASTWGSVLGFVLAGFVCLPAFGTQRTLAGAGVGALLLAAILIGARPRLDPAAGSRRGGRWLLAGAVAAAGPLLLLGLYRPWEREILSSGGFIYGPIYRRGSGEARVPEAMRRRGEILYYREDGDSLVTVRRSRAGTLSLQINGKTEASTGGDMTTQLLAAHLPLLLHPRPEDVLVIGLASGVTLGAAEKHPVRRVRVLEIAPGVVEAARLFAAHNGDALADPRVEVVVDDARSRLVVSPETYDVISSQPSNPWVAGVSNLFTVEFYRLARSRLRPGGLFCQWVQAYRLDPEDLRGIIASFRQVFPQAALWEESAGGGDYFLIGGDAPPRIDPDRLRSASTAAAWEDLARAGVDGPAALLSRFVSGPAGLAALSAGARLHTDDNLYLEWRAPLALFRDSLRDQVAALNRHREPVLSILPEGTPVTDADLVASLRRLRRQRDDRLAMLESLRDADLLALADPFLAAGIDYLRAGRFVEAIEALRKAASEVRESGSAQILLAEAYHGAGLDAAAIVVLEDALARDPGLAPAWNALGRRYVALDRPEEAGAAFRAAVERDCKGPGAASARNNLGAMLLQAGDLDGAERLLWEALDADPDLPAARANLGLVLKRRGDHAGAEVQYRAALALDPLNTDARYNLASLLRLAGRIAEAREELSRLLRVDPADREAARALLEIGGAASGGQEERNVLPRPAPRRAGLPFERRQERRQAQHLPDRPAAAGDPKAGAPSGGLLPAGEEQAEPAAVHQAHPREIDAQPAGAPRQAAAHASSQPLPRRARHQPAGHFHQDLVPRAPLLDPDRLSHRRRSPRGALRQVSAPTTDEYGRLARGVPENRRRMSQSPGEVAGGSAGASGEAAGSEAAGAGVGAAASFCSASRWPAIWARTPPGTSAMDFQAMSRAGALPDRPAAPITRCCDFGLPPAASVSS